MQFNVVKNDIPKYCQQFSWRMRQDILDAILEWAELLADKTRALAPVDTGALKASISIETTDKYRLLVEIRITALSERGKPYPLFQEYGWTTVSGTRVEGKFYFHRAIKATKRRGVAMIKRAIKKAMKASMPIGVDIMADYIIETEYGNFKMNEQGELLTDDQGDY